METLPSCKKITVSSPTVRTDKERAKKNNRILTNSLKEQGIPYLTLDNIIHKHLYCDSLHLNLVGFSILAETFLSCIREINFRLEPKTKGKIMKLIPQK